MRPLPLLSISLLLFVTVLACTQEAPALVEAVPTAGDPAPTAGEPAAVALMPDGERNDGVYAALAAGGIDRVLVDVATDRTVVNFELPDDISYDAAMLYVIGAAARHSGHDGAILTTPFVDGSPLEDTSVIEVPAALTLIADRAETCDLAGVTHRTSLFSAAADVAPQPGFRIRVGLARPGMQTTTSDPSQISPGRAFKCMENLLEWEEQCNSDYFKELQGGPGPRYNEARDRCLLLAKKAWLACIGLGMPRFWDEDRVEDAYDTWIKLVKPRAGSYVAPALGKLGEAATQGVGGPARLGGSPGRKAVGKIVGKIGGAVKDGVTKPLKEDEKERRKEDEETTREIQRRFDSPKETGYEPALQHFQFVHVSEELATEANIGTDAAAKAPIAYVPEELSSTWSAYFPLTPLAEPETYSAVRATELEQCAPLVLGFLKAGLEDWRTLDFEEWAGPSQPEPAPTATQGLMPVPTEAPHLAPTATPGFELVPTATPAPVPTATTAPITVSVGMFFEHTQPGVESEVYVDVSTVAGVSVTAVLTGPGLITEPTQTAESGAEGFVRFTWRIDLFGTYAVNGSAGGGAFSDSIVVE